MKQRLKNTFNLPFGLTVAALLLFGFLALYSASTVESFKNFGNTTYYVQHQFLYGGLIGLVAMIAASRIPYRYWQKYLPLLLVVSLILLVLVKVNGIGVRFGGADRWISLFGFTFQPSELAKLVVVLYLATWLDKKASQIDDFYYGLLPAFSIVLLFCALILWQPDFGTMSVVLGTAAIMFFASGINLRHMGMGALAGGLIMSLVVILEPYRAQRLWAFLNHHADLKGSSYQINQALLAIGSGGLFGYGYGLSRQKHNYLPEVLNDSIFAVVAEELGFLRAVLVLALFGILVYQGYKISKNAPDRFGQLTALGITIWFGLQAVINIAAMLRLIPLTGIPLPFFSYGSSALIVNMLALGIMFNISNTSHAINRSYGKQI
jgi:cell division protein FtsW